jgi:hypothetical protein
MIVVYVLFGLSVVASSLFTLMSLLTIILSWFGIHIYFDFDFEPKEKLKKKPIEKNQSSVVSLENIMPSLNQEDEAPIVHGNQDHMIEEVLHYNDVDDIEDDMDDLTQRLAALGI